jgi:hypothetical protein
MKVFRKSKSFHKSRKFKSFFIQFLFYFAKLGKTFILKVEENKTTDCNLLEFLGILSRTKGFSWEQIFDEKLEFAFFMIERIKEIWSEKVVDCSRDFNYFK